MSTDAISPLRQRMIEDMVARKLGPQSQRSERAMSARALNRCRDSRCAVAGRRARQAMER